MPSYRIRAATPDDVNILVHHRIGMFSDMGVPMNVEAVSNAFRDWLAAMMRNGTYLGWLIVDSEEVVAGAGITVLPWPPGPRSLVGRVAFVYNVYTEPAHRHRGLARLLMTTIHAWCRDHRIDTVLLNASMVGRPLYESMGYQMVGDPMMSATLDR